MYNIGHEVGRYLGLKNNVEFPLTLPKNKVGRSVIFFLMLYVISWKRWLKCSFFILSIRPHKNVQWPADLQSPFSGITVLYRPYHWSFKLYTIMFVTCMYFIRPTLNTCLFPVTRPNLRFFADHKAFYLVCVVQVLFDTC